MNKLQLLEKIMQVNDFQDFLKLKETVDLEYACELDKKTEKGDLSKVTRHVIKTLDKLGKGCDTERFAHEFKDCNGKQVFTNGNWIVRMEEGLTLPKGITVAGEEWTERISQKLAEIHVQNPDDYVTVTGNRLRYYKAKGLTALNIAGKVFFIKSLETVIGFSMSREIRIYKDNSSNLSPSVIVGTSNYFAGLICPVRVDPSATVVEYKPM
jgi:hypothetical protein